MCSNVQLAVCPRQPGSQVLEVSRCGDHDTIVGLWDMFSEHPMEGLSLSSRHFPIPRERLQSQLSVSHFLRDPNGSLCAVHLLRNDQLVGRMGGTPIHGVFGQVPNAKGRPWSSGRLCDWRGDAAGAVTWRCEVVKGRARRSVARHAA